jgi:hypothetical protein
LRNRAYDQLTKIKKLRVVSSPPGPSATAIVACVLPDNIDSMTLRDALLAKHGIIVKMSEKRHSTASEFHRTHSTAKRISMPY